MITSAAVKIKDLRQNKEIIIPCHRHCNAFYILKEFGYRRYIDYEEIAQGFLDEFDNFYNRIDAYIHAVNCGQISVENYPHELYSEDLY